MKLRKRYDEHVGRKRRAEACGREEVRDAAERERNRRALEGYDVQEEKGNGRRVRDEGEGRKRAGGGKREEIKVYASRDLKSHWSD